MKFGELEKLAENRKEIEETGRPSRGRKKKKDNGLFEITNSQCKLCQLDFRVRSQIDTMLATGWAQHEVRKHWNEVLEDEFGPDYITPNNISIHAKRHTSLRETAVRKIIERRAEIITQAEGAVMDHILTKEAVVEAVIYTGLQSMVQGDTQVEAKELLSAVDMLKRLEDEVGGAAQDELWRQFEAFKDAVMLVVPEQYHPEIALQTKHNLSGSDPTVAAKQLVAAVTEELEDDLVQEAVEVEDD